MSQDTLVNLVIIATSISTMGLVFYYVSVIREIHQTIRFTSRFQMFEARDHLVDLVFDGQIAEEDDIWKAVYRGVNRFLGMDRNLDLPRFLYRYVRYRIKEAKNPELAKSSMAFRKKMDMALISNEAFSKVCDEISVALKVLISRRTTCYHRILVFCMVQMIMMAMAGLEAAAALKKTLQSPSASDIAGWDGLRAT